MTTSSLKKCLYDLSKKFHYSTTNDDDDGDDPNDLCKELIALLETNNCHDILSEATNDDDVAGAFLSANERNDIALVQLFLAHGLDVDIKGCNGRTALIQASENDNEELVQYLLNHGANTNCQDDVGSTALFSACQNGSLNVVLLLLASGADVNIQSDDGWTALMKACHRGHQGMVELLLNHGADIELDNILKKTAMDYARNEEIRELLKNHVPTTYVLK